jgi:hypothetical protein
VEEAPESGTTKAICISEAHSGGISIRFESDQGRLTMAILNLIDPARNFARQLQLKVPGGLRLSSTFRSRS